MLYSFQMIDEFMSYGWFYKKQEEGNSQLAKVPSKKIRSGQTRHAGPRQRKEMAQAANERKSSPKSTILTVDHLRRGGILWINENLQRCALAESVMECRAYSDIAKPTFEHPLASGHAALCLTNLSAVRARASSSRPKYLVFCEEGDAISVRRVEFRLVTSQGAAGLKCVAGSGRVRKEKRRECQGVTRLRKASRKDLDTQPSLQSTESRQTLRELRGFRADSERVSISLVTRCKSFFFGRSRGISSSYLSNIRNEKADIITTSFPHIIIDQPSS
jgi:hypothetical protein